MYSYYLIVQSIIINDLQTWCATEVDKVGIFHGNPINWYDFWGFCGPDCLTHEETMTWKKDETVKVTLQYNNPAFRAGLELYGIILPWIVFLGLILTVILPMTGRVPVQSEIPYLFPIFNSSPDDC